MLAVFLHHSISTLAASQSHVVFECTRLGTDLFLILSGCLIDRSLRAKPGYGGYLTRRFLRILPTFAFMLLVYGGLYCAYPACSKLPVDSWPAIVMVLGNITVLPLAFGVRPIITVSWTLGIICVFYVLAPLVTSALKASSTRRQLTAWSLLTVLTFVIGGRAALLPAGVLLSRILDITPAPAWTMVLTSGVLVRALQVEPQIQLICSGIAAFTVCWWALPALSLPPRLESLSRISYSFYLTHGLALLTVQKISLPYEFAMPLALGVAVAGAFLVYRLVEKLFLPTSGNFYQMLTTKAWKTT